MLVSLSAFRLAFPSVVSPADEANVASLLNTALAIAERYTERTLFLTPAKRVFLDCNSERLILPDGPINSVGEVAFDPARTFGPETIVDPTSYYVSLPIGQILLRSKYYGNQVFRVTYSVGWAVDQAPLPIDSIIKELTYYLWKRRSRDQIGSREVTGAEGYRLVYDPTFPKMIKDLLDMEKRY